MVDTANVEDLSKVSQPAEQQAPTAVVAEEQEANGTHQDHVKEALELLYVHFPKAFIKDGNCKALKIGILDDLKQRVAEIDNLSTSKVRAAVRVYTSRLRYLYAVREGAPRVDLDGNEVDVVNAEHATYARERFNEINAKRRPAKPKKQGFGKPFNKNGKRPFNNRSRQEGAEHRSDRPFNKQGRFNNRSNGYNQQNRGRFNNHNSERRFEVAKPSDLQVGRFVFVSLDRRYVKGTISEEVRADKVLVTLQNGATINMPLDQVFISVMNNRNKRPNNGGNRFSHHGDNNHNRNNYRNNPRQAEGSSESNGESHPSEA